MLEIVLYNLSLHFPHERAPDSEETHSCMSLSVFKLVAFRSHENTSVALCVPPS